MKENPKQTPHRPQLFLEIIKNHDAQAPLIEKVTRTSWEFVTPEEWRELARLRADMRELCRAAEKALKWNTDKGSTG